jgi:hypothetical protein
LRFVKRHGRLAPQAPGIAFVLASKDRLLQQNPHTEIGEGPFADQTVLIIGISV